jgi:hypothetical protein
LANAELAYNEGDNILYYGFGTGGAGGTATQVIPIAGSGAYLTTNDLYVHPSGGANTTISAANLRVLSAITVNNLGHVTSVSSKDLTSSDIPNLSTDILTSGTLGVGRGGIGAATLTQNNILVGNGANAISAPYSVETTLTGGTSAIPRADAVKTYVDNLLSANDAMVFKGTIGTGGTVTSLPTTHSAGWAYRVITAATFAGKVCEIGDLLIAVIDRSGSSNSNDDWTVVQTNIDGAVVGPVSSTDNALAVFNGATGKLIKNSSFVPTIVGSGLINLTDPGAIRFLRINANNTVSTLSDTDFRTAIGAGTSSTVGTVTSVGGTGSAAGLTLTGTVTTTGNLTLGGTLSTPVSTINDSTTVGQNLVKLTNPSAIRFLRINADNTITSLSDSDFRTAIGAGTSSTVGTVTSVAALTLGTTGTDVGSTVANGTTTPVITLNIPTASAANRGALSSADWTTFNNKSPSVGSTNITTLGTITTGTWSASNIAVDKGGTGQNSYTNGQLLIGNTTGNTLTKATLTSGSNITITNGTGSITIAATDTNTATAADNILDGSNIGTEITYAPYATNQAASATPRFYNTTDDPSGSSRLNVSAYLYATRLYDSGSRVVTASTICADAGNCTWDGGSF